VNTVAVCDTEPIAIEGLRSLLESADELRVVAAESSLADGMDAVRALAPSLLM
jgi:DNA-binding NarL/FixJ family response regulator